MSSLMQFNGSITRKGVFLQCYQTTPNPDPILASLESSGDNTDCLYMPGGKVLPRLWVFPRKPKGMCGCWVVFQFNGSEHVPDLSCPMALFQRPRDARPMTIADTIRTWQS